MLDTKIQIRYIARMAKPITIPAGRKCYACDRKPVGVTENWASGKPVIEAACERHADPKIPAVHRCCYCDGDRPTMEDGDGFHYHKKCHRIVVNDGRPY